MFDYNAESGEIWLADEIGPDWRGLISGDFVRNALSKMNGKHVSIYLNTPGGDVDEGISIYNAIKRHNGGVTTIADSLAASMGSYLLQAGDRRVVAANAMVMIHDPWTIGVGNSSQLRKLADVLDKFAERMIPDYASRSGKSEQEIISIMEEETWYTGKEAVDAGFADEVESIERDFNPSALAALRHLSRKAPAALFEKREKAKQVADELRPVLPFPRRAAAKVAAAKISI